jgi:hypothetical protein
VSNQFYINNASTNVFPNDANKSPINQQNRSLTNASEANKSTRTPNANSFNYYSSSNPQFQQTQSHTQSKPQQSPLQSSQPVSQKSTTINLVTSPDLLSKIGKNGEILIINNNVNNFINNITHHHEGNEQSNNKFITNVGIAEGL